MANHHFNVSDDLDDRTFQLMHVPCLKDDISIVGPRGFVKIIHIFICSLQISGFVGSAILHLSNPAVCICRRAISTLCLEHRWISPKTICVFSNSNWYIHICQSLLFSSLLINQNSLVQPIFTQPFLQSDVWLWIKIFGDGWRDSASLDFSPP